MSSKNSSEHIFVVVGDIFSDISKMMTQVITESEAIDRIQTATCPDTQTIFSIGQGVDHHMLENAIKRRARREPEFSDRFILRGNDVMPRAVKRLAHKEKTANILASFPEKLSEDTYRLDLHFASSNEFFGDHMTGMHIQGMALTEAARQAFLVVTEEFFLHDVDADFYFVIKSLDSRYINFVFPLSASLDYRVVKHAKKPTHQSFEVAMKLMQAGQVCAEFDISFTAFEKQRISDREIEVFGERLDAVVKALAPILDTSAPVREAAPVVAVAEL